MRPGIEAAAEALALFGVLFVGVGGATRTESAVWIGAALIAAAALAWLSTNRPRF